LEGSANGFADSTDFDALGSNSDGLLDFSGGDVVRTAVFTYETVVAPVPLPASLPLLAGGLGLMGYFGSRRKNSKAAELKRVWGLTFPNQSPRRGNRQLLAD
jgi:hypothetical protein